MNATCRTVSRTRFLFLFALLLAGLSPPHLVGQDGTGLVTGRVLDRDSLRPVEDVAVRLTDTGFATYSSEEGLFRFSEVPAGTYTLTLSHIAYGQHRDTLRVPGGTELAVRIALAKQAIELDPVVVTGLSGTELRRRSRGTRFNEITRQEIAESSSSLRTLSDVVSQHVPGVRVRKRSTAPGMNPCLEFRSPATVQSPRLCRYPMVYLDGVRVIDEGMLLATLSPDDVHRVEVLPPSEAGALYGTDSAWGVLLVETRIGVERPAALSDEADEGLYRWELEAEPHPWGRAFGGALLGNALGLGLGYLVAHRCVDLEDLAYNTFESRCGTWTTAGLQTLAVSLPLLGSSLGARWGGRTTLSEGKLLPSLVAASTVLLPSYLVASSGAGTGDALQWVGAGLVTLGVPAAVTLADRLFRTIRE